MLAAHPTIVAARTLHEAVTDTPGATPLHLHRDDDGEVVEAALPTRLLEA